MMSWESDQLIVLSERESRLQGEGADVDTQPAKETLTEHEGTATVQTSLLGIAKLAADASIYEEPGAGKLHAGICAGAVG